MDREQAEELEELMVMVRNNADVRLSVYERIEYLTSLKEKRLCKEEK